MTSGPGLALILSLLSTMLGTDMDPNAFPMSKLYKRVELS